MTRSPTVRQTSTIGGNLDLIQLLDTILREKELDIEFEDYGTGVNLRQRIYRFRKLLLKKADLDTQELIEKGMLPAGTIASTPYDSVYILYPTLSKADRAKLPAHQKFLMQFRLRNSNELLSAMRRPDGTPIALQAEDETALEDEVTDLQRSLGLRN